MDFSYKPAAVSLRRDDEACFPIVILGDFSGRRPHPANSSSPTRPERIDCDTFEKVFEHFDVKLALPPAKPSDKELVLRFRRLEDFHPDQILRQAEFLSRLVDLRTRLLDPATVEAAIGEAQGFLEIPAAPDPLPLQSVETPEELLSRLLGKPATRSPKDIAPAASTVEDLIQRLVAPNIERGPNPQQTHIVRLVEDELSNRLRELLHHPDFQALESTWRAVDFLIRESGDQIKSYLIDVTKNELAEMLAAGDLSRTTIFKQLQEIGPAVILGVYVFGSDDESLLKALGNLAQAHHVAFITGASPEIVGCPSFGSRPDPDDWEHAADFGAFDALRRAPEAAFLGLVMPRFLLRQPYGAASDPIETFPFEEMLPQPEHESYLWGNSAVLCGYLLAETSAAEEGADPDASPGGEIIGLPVHTFTAENETQVKPCAEAWLSDRALEAILNYGIMPVASIRGRDAVEIRALRAFSRPAKPLPVGNG